MKQIAFRRRGVKHGQRVIGIATHAPSANPMAKLTAAGSVPALSLFASNVFAQGAGGGAGSLVSLLPLVLIFVLFYFLLIRPQQKRAKQHKDMVASLKKGDEVVTNGGTLGKVTDVDDNFVSLEVATNVNIKVQRHAVAQMMPKGTIKKA